MSHQGPTEKEQIDVQGDIAYDIVEFITDTWPDVSAPFLNHIFVRSMLPFSLRQSCLPFASHI